MDTTRLLLLPAHADDAARCLRIGADGRVLERCVPTADAPLSQAVPGERTLVAVPGTEVRASWLQIQAHSPAQARAAAHKMLAGEVAGNADGLHVAVAADGDEHLVLVADPAHMRDWLAQAAALGCSADAVVPDYLLVPSGDGGVQALDDGGTWRVHGRRTAFSAEPALAACLLEGVPHTRVTNMARIEDLLAAGAVAGSPIDLLQGDFARSGEAPRARHSWRRAAVIAGLLVLSPPLLLATQALRHEWNARQLDEDARAIVARIAPDHLGATPAEATTQALASLDAGNRFARDMHALLAAISSQPDVELDRLQYTAGSIEAGVRHRDAAALAKVVSALEAAGLPAQASDTHPSGDGLASVLRIGGGA